MCTPADVGHNRQEFHNQFALIRKKPKMKTLRFIPRLLLLIWLSAGANALMAQQPDLQYFRPWDQQGINVFEPSKTADQPEWDGFKIRIGGSFTQEFQALSHSNVDTSAAQVNKLYDLGSGFNLAMANLMLDFQIADGIRVSLENYMSTRHHPEFWVKGGYIQIDKLPMFNNPQWFEDYLRVKVGHFQPNYGDMQFRRNDGGNAMYNPFVENMILDAFTTEIGAEVYVFPLEGFMAMLGMTSGFINGNVAMYPDVPLNPADLEPTKKNPSVFAKLAYDNQFSDDFRFRLSASYYRNASIQRNTLFAGDRAGSQYYFAMEPAVVNGVTTSAANAFTSGRLNPGFTNEVGTFMINPFVKFKGLELFGVIEMASGRTYREADSRDFSQYAGEVVYRFCKDEQLFVGGRYNVVNGRLSGYAEDISIDRLAFSAGWFPTPNLLLKGEYVMQNYNDFAGTDARHQGEFSGFAMQAVVGF